MKKSTLGKALDNQLFFLLEPCCTHERLDNSPKLFKLDWITSPALNSKDQTSLLYDQDIEDSILSTVRELVSLLHDQCNHPTRTMLITK